METPKNSENVRRQMEEVRGHLDDDLGALLANARLMVDWRRYVKCHPWLAVGAAVATGFLLIPRRPRPVNLDGNALAELARQNRLTVQLGAKPEGKGQVAGTLMAMALAAARRGATTWISDQVGQAVQRWRAKNQAESQPPPVAHDQG